MTDNERTNYIKKFNEIDYLFMIGYLWNNAYHDFGNGVPLNLTESHTLQYIVEHSNVKVTDLANHFLFTLSAASKIVTRLEKKGLVIKEKHPDNRKNIYLQATELGLLANAAHMRHDKEYYGEAFDMLMQHHSTEELESFFNVLNSYIKHHP